MNVLQEVGSPSHGNIHNTYHLVVSEKHCFVTSPYCINMHIIEISDGFEILIMLKDPFVRPWKLHFDNINVLLKSRGV